MRINRDKYLSKIAVCKDDGLIKIITGIRRCGKTYLLFNIYADYLLGNGIKKDQIIKFAFDNDEDIDRLSPFFPDEPAKIYIDKERTKYIVNSKKFRAYINSIARKESRYYILLDEVQLLEDFVPTLNGFLRHENYDIYITGSNSRFLSSDVASEFRARGEQIYISPLTFKEFYDCHSLSFEEAYSEYQRYGGLPHLSTIEGDDRKEKYLEEVFEQLYFKDLIERNGIENRESFGILVDILASSISCYTNPGNIEKTFRSEMKTTYHHDTIAKHIGFLKECFLIREAKRYDIKGRKYIGANSKYYFIDPGLRNIRLNFRQQEPTHMMENIIYNELLARGYRVDVGIVTKYERDEEKKSYADQLEVDFICNCGGKRIYIQSAYSIPDAEKRAQESRPLQSINDSFQKVVIVKDTFKPWTDNNGILYLSLRDFLLNQDPFAY